MSVAATQEPQVGSQRDGRPKGVSSVVWDAAGYGFLAENAHFADVCESSNIRFHRPQLPRHECARGQGSIRPCVAISNLALEMPFDFICANQLEKQIRRHSADGELVFGDAVVVPIPAEFYDSLERLVVNINESDPAIPIPLI